MAAVKVKALRKHLCCSICMDIYTDPVTLSCQHHFCKQCIQQCLRIREKCPMCRVDAPRDEPRHINRTLRDMAEELKEERKASTKEITRGTKPALAPKPTSTFSAPRNNKDLCQAHGEPLRLYCETDKGLMCVVCRDGKEHRGHSFKPVREAQDEISEILTASLFHLQEDIAEVESHQLREGDFVEKTKKRNVVLLDQLKIRFAELHELLHQKEEQAVKETKELDMESCSQLVAISQVLEEGRGRQETLKAGWGIQDPLDFLRWWREEGQDPTPEEHYYCSLNELKLGPLIKKCPPASPERPWSSGGGGEESHLQSLVGFLAAENLESFLSRHINPPPVATGGHQRAVLKRDDDDHSPFESDTESHAVADDEPLPASPSLTTPKKAVKNIFGLFRKK